MRIIAGAWRGRPLEAPPGKATRPTSDRAREGLFSMLASRLGSFEDLAGRRSLRRHRRARPGGALPRRRALHLRREGPHRARHPAAQYRPARRRRQGRDSRPGCRACPAPAPPFRPDPDGPALWRRPRPAGARPRRRLARAGRLAQPRGAWRGCPLLRRGWRSRPSAVSARRACSCSGGIPPETLISAFEIAFSSRCPARHSGGRQGGFSNARTNPQG